MCPTCGWVRTIRVRLRDPLEQNMQQISLSPTLVRVRRQSLSSGEPRRAASPSVPKDPRWHLLDLAKSCRRSLNLRDRDIAVLRGLLSLVPAQAAPNEVVVFASNRVLVERCDGIDERTLRRRLAHLQKCGLLMRRSSPNGKRYQVRGDQQEPLLTYGIDLGPIFQIRDQLEAMADECRREEARVRTLKSLIRDALFKKSASHTECLQEEARLALRRTLTSEQLRDILTRLDELPADGSTGPTPEPNSQSNQLTVSNGQTDRHIQSLNKEILEYEEAASRPQPAAKKPSHEVSHPDDLTVTECIKLTATAQSFSSRPPESWEDIIELSASLAPAIGVGSTSFRQAQEQLGRHGCALAILGLVEAYGRIRKPAAYLNTLIQRSRRHGIELISMFRSLVRPVSRA